MYINMTFGQATCQLFCRYSQSTLAVSCVCWIVPTVTCDSIKKTCGCSCLKCTDLWHNWWVAGVLTALPPKLNVKTGLLPSLYFGIYYSFRFSTCCLLRFSECFLVISGFWIAVKNRICYSFSIVVSQWAPFSWVSPWLKPLVTSLYLIKVGLYYR